MRFLYILIIGAMLGILGAVAAVALTGGDSPAIGQFSAEALDRPASDADRPVAFSVRPGEAAGSIGDRLEQQKLIRSSLLFRWLVSSFGVESNLAAGEYELSPAMTTTAIIQKLNKGVVRTVSVTLPEGWRNEQFATRVDRSGAFSQAEWDNALGRATSNAQQRGIVPQGQSLQGYLLPNTYSLAPGSSADSFVEGLVAAFDRAVTSDMRRQFEARGLTLHQAVTLASIVEREAVADSERPIIASVFLNRIKLGMPLQADPTVQFAVATPPSVEQYGWWKTGLTLTDLRTQSPYNTYVVRSLPPGPIANPGIASLRAVAEPATTDFLYFVAKDARSHLFARTLEEHNRNVAQVQPGR